jgi:DnaK suppressor protein
MRDLFFWAAVHMQPAVYNRSVVDLEHYRQKLILKEQELLRDLANTESEALQATAPDVQDEMDMVVRSEEKDALMDHHSRGYELLRQVRDALQRIEDGSYGKCLACGRPIDPKRLEAVPWAAYDIQHQDRAERTED